jgi:L-ascorbate metabolism protein UlaG (beta-lactamase superfamily)
MEAMKQTVLFLIIVLVFLSGSCATAPPPFDEAAWKTAVENQDTEKLYAPHFKEGAYFNPWMPMDQGRLGQFLKWRFSKKADYTPQERMHLPEVVPDLDSRIQKMAEEDFIAWGGHATFLMRVQGVYWLTDPIFSKRALLPKRVTPSALNSESLTGFTGQLNVLISHSHYDHLDKQTIRSLPRHARIFVPPGLKDYIQSFFEGTVVEIDWWEHIDLGGGTQLVCLPAQHWSRRIGQAVNTTLWASYLLITPAVSIYYGGDSGYFAGYREIGRRFPGIDYALIPLTAYHPRWFMHYAHMNAAESIQAFRDLKAEYYIPTQWGTFQLGDNPPGYPALDLKRNIAEMKLDPAKFIIMNIGQVEVISNPLAQRSEIRPQ